MSGVLTRPRSAGSPGPLRWCSTATSWCCRCPVPRGRRWASIRTKVVGRPLRDTSPDAAYAIVAPHYAAVLAGEERAFELPLRGGRSHWLTARPVRVSPDAPVEGVLAVSWDQTGARRVGGDLPAAGRERDRRRHPPRPPGPLPLHLAVDDRDLRLDAGGAARPLELRADPPRRRRRGGRRAGGRLARGARRHDRVPHPPPRRLLRVGGELVPLGRSTPGRRR